MGNKPLRKLIDETNKRHPIFDIKYISLNLWQPLLINDEKNQNSAP